MFIIFLMVVIFSVPSTGKPATSQSPLDKAKQIVSILKSKDMQKLAPLVHPKKGLMIIPLPNNLFGVIFKPKQISKLFNDKTVYTWGNAAGSGIPIELNFSEYYKLYIYDRDFAKSPVSSYKKVYKSATVTFYSKGPEDPNIGWKSLLLKLEKFNGNWYLVSIIHDEWAP